MDIHSLRSVYFIGIGGIGMSALARYFLARNVKVAGYDRTSSDITDALIREGAVIHFEENISRIPADADLVIYTPAVPKDHKELIYAGKKGYPVMKRSEMLGLITELHPTIAVAGTHGKTTTSSMIAHIFRTAGKDFTAFLGGIAKNYRSNYITGEHRQADPAEKSLFIAEADEYDRSFLRLHPDTAIVTSADADHLDIYSGLGEMRAAFAQFTGQIKPGGKLIIKKGVDLPAGPGKGVTTYTYLLSGGADFYPVNVRMKGIETKFDLVTPNGIFKDVSLGLPGMFNLENAMAAAATAILWDIPEEPWKTALATFRGVQRRFDIQIHRDDFVYIDDYAHHPEELRSCILAARELFPGKKITGIFQPHLYTRTRDLADEFAASLGLLDDLILLEIYPARELPIPGVSSQMLLDRIGLKSKMLCSRDRVTEELAKRDPGVLLTLGAGDIDQLVEPIVEFYNQKRSG
jgi:UDP-N-acetylmuramate--alanine ligase